MDPRRYLILLCLMPVLLACGFAGFNWFMDPFGIYNPPVVAGLNDVHPATATHGFLHKVEAVKRLRPDAVITGTSRAETCLDPRPEFFQGLTPYNLALPSASVAEQRMLLEFAHSVRPLKRAVITLDFFAFDARKKDTPGFDAARFAAGRPYALLLSLDTVSASLSQLLREKGTQAYIAPNGTRVPDDFAAVAHERGAGWAFRRGRFTDPDADTATRAIGSRAMKQLRDMIGFAHDNNIDAQFVILPLHDTYHAMLKETGQDDFMKKWEHMVQAALKAEARKRGRDVFPLLRFAQRRGYSDEPVPADGDRVTATHWFWDPSHCKSALGDTILRKLAAPSRDGSDTVQPQ